MNLGQILLVVAVVLFILAAAGKGTSRLVPWGLAAFAGSFLV